MAKKLLFLPILLLLVCCTQSKKALQKLEQTAKEATTSLQPTLEDAAKKADPDYQLSEKEEGLVSSSNAFSLKLFQLLANKKGEGECGSLTNGRHLFAEYAQQWGEWEDTSGYLKGSRLYC